MSKTIISLISQLIDMNQRGAIAQKLATTLHVDDVIIFVKDKELRVLLPAPGFPQTLPHLDAWRPFLDRCHKSGTFCATLPHLINGTQSEVTALVYEGKVAVMLLGAQPHQEQVGYLKMLLPLLRPIFHHEQFVAQTQSYIQQAEASATEYQNIAHKLDMTRRSLQAVLSEKETEIQERINSEAALANSEQRFRFLAESLSAMIFTTHPNGALDYISPQWMHFTGLTIEEIRRHGILNLLHPDETAIMREHWQHSIKTGRPIKKEVRVYHADGTYRWHLARAEAKRNKYGTVSMWVGSCIDIEDVKTDMAKKRELEKQTLRLTKQQQDLLELNAAKDEFIRLASHQLRTPATGVKMYIGMLMGDYVESPSPGQMKLLEHAYKSNDRQLQIIDDLLKVAIIDAGKVVLKKETCHLVELINDIVHELRHSLDARNQQLVFTPPKKDIKVQVDKRFMRMMIENLIDNASKYSQDNTVITIKIEQTSATKIHIIDQGVGIAKKDQALLFKKFSRVHNTRSITAAGTGLGLYWAKEVANLHGGTITVTSKLQYGSTFTIKLP